MASLGSRLKSVTGLLTERRLTLFWLLLIILLGAGLRLYDLEGKSLWCDEIFTARSSQRSIPGLIKWIARSDVQSPFYYIVVHFFMYLGKSDFVIRLPSAILGLLSIPLTYALAKMLLGEKEGLISAFLLSISAYHIRYSQEARMYTLFVFLSLLSLSFLYRAMEKNDRKLWFGFTISAVLNLHTIYFAFLVLASELMFASLVLAVSRLPNLRKVILSDLLKGARNPTRDWGRQPLGYGRFPSPSLSSKFSMLFLSVAAIGILYLPWLPTLVGFVSRQTGGMEETELPPRGFELSVSSFDKLLSTYGAGGGVALYVFGGAFLLGFLACIYQRQWKQAFLVLLWTSTPFITLSLVRGTHTLFLRYLIFLLPIYLVLIAKGITSVSQLICQLTSRVVNLRVQPLGTSLVIAVVVFGTLSIDPVAKYYAWEKEDWRGVASYLVDHMEPDDVILCDGEMYAVGGDAQRCANGVTYYLSESFQDRHILATDSDIPQKIKDHAGEAQTVWIVLWHQKPVSERARERLTLRTLSQSAEFESVLVTSVGEGENLVENTISALNTLIDLQPRSEARFDLYLSLTEIYAWQGDLERAQQALAAATVVQPYYHAARARLERISGQLQIDIDLGTADYHLGLGDAYLADGKAQEAAQEYETALALNPELDQQTWFHLSLARAYEESGRREEAIREYERVLELEPDNPAAQRALDALGE